MFPRLYIILTCLMIGTQCYAQDSTPDSSAFCDRLLNKEHSIPAALTRVMGEWQSCSLKDYEETEFGVFAKIIAQWDSVILTVEYKAPEITIYIVETNAETPLSSEWYEKNKTKLIDPYFEMNWDFDEFPGPTSEYYTASSAGSNAQFWVERNTAGDVTWMRFSYAL